MSKTVAEVLTTTLADIGAKQVFGVVGDALNPFTDAIRRDGRMEWLGVRHEEGAALAAAGQAKLTGRLGVCAGTTGPGANHLIAGLYEARHDHAPVLAIAGDVPRNLAGVDYHQSANHVQAFRDACVYVTDVTSPDGAPGQIHEAIASAYNRRGPALLNIPQDVFGAVTSKPLPSLATLRMPPEITPDGRDLDAAASLIDGAGKVVLFVGFGARSARAEILALADRIKAPIVHTYRGLDIYPFDDPHVIGGIGLIGSKAAYDAMHACDVLVMIGTDYPYGQFLPRQAQVVQIDERGFAIGRRLSVAQPVVGSSRPAIQGLLDRVRPKEDGSFLEKARSEWADWKEMLRTKADPARSADRIHPQALARAVSELAAENAVFSVDTGEVTLWTGNWSCPRGGQNFTGSFNNGAVGTALGIANGVQALDRARQVIAMCGDGGFAMLMQEFITSVQHGLPLKVVVFNNGGWGLVRLEMEEAGIPEFSQGTHVRNPDFALFAEACGGTGFRITDPKELRTTLRKALETPGPVVVDVTVDPDELPSAPHLEPGLVWRFALAKAKEVVGKLGG